MDQTMKPLHAEPAKSYTLPGWAYTDALQFEREREAIFNRSWHYAGPLSQLANPGDYLTAGILDQNVIVIRGKDGELRGFYNVCQHRAHELLKGRGCAKVITCPYHAWSYHADGRLRTARGTEKMADFNASEFQLKPVRIEVFADHFVFYNLDENAAPLADQAGDLAQELKDEVLSDGTVAVTNYPDGKIACNWKVAVDNYLECYHCAPAHPAFADLVSMDDYKTQARGLWSSQKGTVGRYDNKAYPLRRNAPEQRALFWWLWPTTTFNVLPGSPSLGVFSFLPGGPALTVTRGDRYAVPGSESPEEDAARLEYGRTVLGPEDNALCESVQRGLASKGYSQGRFIADPDGSVITEQAVHHFHRLVAQALEL
jgi:carnitine monooxygenase subunit